MTLQIRGRIFPKTSAICAARLEDRPASYGVAGTPFTQADFTSITYSVMDTTTGDPVVSNGVTYQNLPLTVSAVIFDTLQAWSEDARGYNFLYTVGPGAFPQNGAEYQVEVKFTLADGRVGYAVFVPTTDQIYSA